METVKTQESRVRRLAHRAGYRVHKSRQGEQVENHGEYMERLHPDLTIARGEGMWLLPQNFIGSPLHTEFFGAAG